MGGGSGIKCREKCLKGKGEERKVSFAKKNFFAVYRRDIPLRLLLTRVGSKTERDAIFFLSPSAADSSHGMCCHPLPVFIN